MSSSNENEPINPTLDKGVVSCWAVVINSTVGCESDATATSVIAVFATLEKAKLYLPILTKKINWKHYYEGELDIEEIPFEPCS